MSDRHDLAKSTTFDLYPDVTGDVATWPVLFRRVEDGKEIVCYDPTPWDTKQLQAAYRALNP